MRCPKDSTSILGFGTSTVCCAVLYLFCNTLVMCLSLPCRAAAVASCPNWLSCRHSFSGQSLHVDCNSNSCVAATNMGFTTALAFVVDHIGSGSEQQKKKTPRLLGIVTRLSVPRSLVKSQARGGRSFRSALNSTHASKANQQQHLLWLCALQNMITASATLSSRCCSWLSN